VLGTRKEDSVYEPENIPDFSSGESFFKERIQMLSLGSGFVVGTMQKNLAEPVLD